MRDAGSTLKHGQESRSGKQGFYFLVIGGVYSHDTPVEDVSFTLTGLQEFFFPAGYKDLVKFSNAPLATVSVPFGTIEITNVASFDFLHKDITPQFYCRDPDAIDALKSAFEKIKEEHPQALFMLKKDIVYHLRLRFSAGITLKSAWQKISEIADLFAMLIYGPTHPESLNIARQTEGGCPASEDVYPAMGLNQSTIDICTRNASHFHMPITQHTVDLSKLLTTWPKNASHFATAVSAIQHEVGFRTMHSAHDGVHAGRGGDRRLESLAVHLRVFQEKRERRPDARIQTDPGPFEHVVAARSAGCRVRSNTLTPYPGTPLYDTVDHAY